MVDAQTKVDFRAVRVNVITQYGNCVSHFGYKINELKIAANNSAGQLFKISHTLNYRVIKN